MQKSISVNGKNEVGEVEVNTKWAQGVGPELIPTRKRNSLAANHRDISQKIISPLYRVIFVNDNEKR